MNSGSYGHSPSLIEMGGLDEISAYVIMTEGIMIPRLIHGVGGVAELSYGRSPSTVYDINGACYITSTGYPTDVGYSIPNSYGLSAPI